MAERKVGRRKLTKSAVGDIRDRISLERRVRLPPQDFENSDGSEVLTVIAEVWAKVETAFMISQGQGDANYNGVNLEKKPAYRFTIRYRGDLNSSNTVVRFRGKLFAIGEIGNPELRNEYETLVCPLRGLDTLEANQ